MTIAIIDNGSLEPAAHRNLRALAAALSARTGQTIHAISWKHSDRIAPASLGGNPAWTLDSWVRTRVAAGEVDFIFIPFFVSPQGAIGSWLRRDLEKLQQELGGAFRFGFTPGLATHGTLVRIATARIRETIAAKRLSRPAVIVVDHGGPSAASAQLRDDVAAALQHELANEIRGLTAASLEGEDHAHNRPLFVDALTLPGFTHGDVVIAPLFLAPGRHAGPRGDLAQLVAGAEDRGASADAPNPLRCHFTELIGTHPLVIDVLADALIQTVSTFHAAA